MRLTKILFTGGSSLKYYQRYLERVMQKDYLSMTYDPIMGYNETKKKDWYYGEHPPWSSNFMAENREGKKPVLVPPIKEWNIFHGDIKTPGTTIVRRVHTMASLAEGVLLGLGNPLLDITIQSDQAFLDKYKLKSNDAILAGPEHLAMFDEMMTKYKPIYLAGGATQNSIRIAQWLLAKPNCTTFFGCVGNDEKADVLRQVAKESGVNVQYCVTDQLPTGTCGAIITGEDRSLVAYLGAADFFRHEWMEMPEQWQYVQKAQYVYIGGFVFTVCNQAIFDLAKHCCDHQKTLIMNLSAPFLCKYYASKQPNIIQYIDILFGNETEAATLCKLLGLPDTNLAEMALAVAELPKANTSRQRIVVFTQGKEPMVVAHGNHVKEYPVKPVAKELIKDTNGCGDAFVGGFLSELIRGHDIEQCVQKGMYASRVVIQNWGCNYTYLPADLEK